MRRKHQGSQPHLEVALLEHHIYDLAGGTHYTGKLHGSLAAELPMGEFVRIRTWETVRLEHPLTWKEAASLNKSDATGFSKYKRGEMSERFFSEAEIFVAAVEKAQELGYDALFVGSTSCCSPQEMLYGPKMDQMNEIFERWDRLYDHTNNPPLHLVDPIEHEFGRLGYSLGLTDRIGAPQLGRR